MRGAKMIRRRDGFTLIELLVVIAIIAILASILFPVFANARERARQAGCLSNLKQLTAALRMYVDDYSGRAPSVGVFMGTATDWCGCTGVGKPVYLHKAQLMPYVRNSGVFLCPTDRGRKADAIENAPKDYPLSYSMNWHLHHRVLDSVRHARFARLLVFIHEDHKTINDGLFMWEWDSTHKDDLPDKVHYDGTTASYLDGHAQWVSYDNLCAARDAREWYVPAQ